MARHSFSALWYAWLLLPFIMRSANCAMTGRHQRLSLNALVNPSATFAWRGQRLSVLEHKRWPRLATWPSHVSCGQFTCACRIIRIMPRQDGAVMRQSTSEGVAAEWRRMMTAAKMAADVHAARGIMSRLVTTPSRRPTINNKPFRHRATAMHRGRARPQNSGKKRNRDAAHFMRNQSYRQRRGGVACR